MSALTADDQSRQAKVQVAEDAWNTREPDVVAQAYTEDSEWRNRTEFFKGRDAGSARTATNNRRYRA